MYKAKDRLLLYASVVSLVGLLITSIIIPYVQTNIEDYNDELTTILMRKNLFDVQAFASLQTLSTMNIVQYIGNLTGRYAILEAPPEAINYRDFEYDSLYENLSKGEYSDAYKNEQIQSYLQRRTTLFMNASNIEKTNMDRWMISNPVCFKIFNCELLMKILYLTQIILLIITFILYLQIIKRFNNKT